ncbi:MAG TPA: hypothetical protein VFX61_08120 [Micromonosporaceae bacterium]|nr:hypothetical protein [Micromonosporaceae bacterium]
MTCWQRRTDALLALFVAVAGIAGMLLLAVPARAADLFVEVDPSTVQAGGQVNIRGSCNNNTMPATAESAAFGTVTLHPQNGVLTGAAMVPATTRSDTYRVQLTCPDGRTTTTRLNVVAGAMPSRGPAAGFGGALNDGPGSLLLTGGLAALVAGTVLGISAYRRRVAQGAGSGH